MTNNSNKTKLVSKLYNVCESKDKTRYMDIYSNDYYELSLSKSDTVNNFLNIIASVVIATCSTTLLTYFYNKMIYCYIPHGFFIKSLHLHCTNLSKFPGTGSIVGCEPPTFQPYCAPLKMSDSQ